MNVELPPFKNGEHNSESASTIDRVITPLINFWDFSNSIWANKSESDGNQITNKQ